MGGRVWQAAHDLNANYVLQKLIMVMHQRSSQFIIDELLRFPGAASCASRNRFGCRVLQRLLEFCSPAQMAEICEDLMQHAVENCRDRYGKYAMQCLLEHGTVCQRERLVRVLSAHMDSLGRDVHACSVIGKALSTGAREEQQALSDVVVSKPGLVRNMRQTKQGQYVVTLAFQLSKVSGSNETAKSVKDIIREKATNTAPPPVVPNSAQLPQARSRRRGGGGGASAQAQAEARDLLVSLDAACRRRQSTRINKAMERAQCILNSSVMPPSLIAEATQACEQAMQILWSILAKEAQH